MVPQQMTALLSPGTYLIELGLTTEVSPDVIVEALEMMGFEDVLVDPESASSLPSPSPTEDERVLAFRKLWLAWGYPSTGAPAPNSGIGGPPSDNVLENWRVMARTKNEILVHDTTLVEWIYAHRLSDAVNPYIETLSAQVEPFSLETGEVYDLVFLAWLKLQSSAEEAREALVKMHGFRPLKIFPLRRNLRMPGRPGADGALWYAVGIWEGPTSIVVDQDPLFFQAATKAEA